MAIDTLQKLLHGFTAQGATRVFFKKLAPNDNNKQQVYLGASFGVINILPFKDIREDPGVARPNFKASLRFYWLDRTGTAHVAPNAQLILYPDYPEVRLSGFLKGCKEAPSDLMRAYPRPPEGRVLFFAVKDDQTILGFVVGPTDPIATEALAAPNAKRLGEVFYELSLSLVIDTKTELLQRLRAIHDNKWYVSQRLKSKGVLLKPYTARNAGGYTLEAIFGIVPNGISEPDFKGWELKSFKVKGISKILGGRLTLMTPEPTIGYYSTHGAEAFVRKYGHKGTEHDTLYFTGNHKVGEICTTSKLTLTMVGFDPFRQKIVDIKGGLHLLDSKGTITAGWSFVDLLEHWKRKHAQAAYVPYIGKGSSPDEYWFGNNVLLGEGASVEKFLNAFTAKTIIYDPGVKIAAASTKPKVKPRSQFRITSKNLESLYEKFSIVDVTKI